MSHRSSPVQQISRFALLTTGLPGRRRPLRRNDHTGWGITVYPRPTITADPRYLDAAADDFEVAADSPVASWGLWNGS